MSKFAPIHIISGYSFLRSGLTIKKIEKAIKDNHFDNGLANKLDLYQLGVQDEQISSCDFDTVTDDRFYSAYLKIPVGRLVSLIYLK